MTGLAIANVHSWGLRISSLSYRKREGKKKQEREWEQMNVGVGPTLSGKMRAVIKGRRRINMMAQTIRKCYNEWFELLPRA